MPDFKLLYNQVKKFWQTRNSNYFYSLRSVLGIITLMQVFYVLYCILYYMLNNVGVFTSIRYFLKRDINIISIPIFILLTINFYTIISRFGNGRVNVVGFFDHFFLIRHKKQSYPSLTASILIQLIWSISLIKISILLFV